METENLDISLISATKLSSSWPIVSGSLDDAITCESSFSVVSDSDNIDNLSRKPPLILRRPSPDSGPCEITIFFTQQHEIRQVYVRSTARVYEIYYAVKENGDNEYLCTVRCGVAAKIEELHQETNGVGLSTSSSNSNGSSYEGHSRSESGGSANEDGWVDVKVKNSSILDTGDSCLTKKVESCIERGNQDCFEATAEISDVDPLMSATLRLLSVQSGEYIYIDEIYVFADPVVSAETNSSPNKQETSSESATMSLLIPTLLQLSKLQRNQRQEHIDSSAGLGKHQDTEHKSVGVPVEFSSSQSESIQEIMRNGTSAPISQPGFPVQKLDFQNNPYPSSEGNAFSCSRIERTLDELISRVAKIEHFCLRFEEIMLKPICNMEARLERVEQQLDAFVKTAKVTMTACNKMSAPEFSCTDSESNVKVSMTACNKISAPEFSCSGSESNSIVTGGNGSPGTRKSESLMKSDGLFQGTSITSSDAYPQPIDVSLSTTASQLLPSLVVTAPDFSSSDDEGENGPFEALKDSQKDSPKKPLSIDDCLASALAGFLSSASNDADMVEEISGISNKEESGNIFVSELIKSDNHTIPSVHIDGTDISGKDIVEIEESFGSDNCIEEATESVDEHCLIFEKEDDEKPLDLHLVKTDISGLSVDIISTEADDDANQSCVFESSDSHATDTSVSALGVPTDSVDSSSSEETAKACPGVLLNILKLQSPATVDFEIPILDVKFVSHERSSISSFDALLVDVPDLCGEVCCLEDDYATSSSEQYDLVIIDNVDSAASETPINPLICLESLDEFDSGSMPVMEEAEQQECSIQDIGASLI